ncbi:TIGR04282 family arsenosugar biosynthesis glycosyltransferase [Ruegeria pomeroyi]|uniref:Glycosyltransferase n=2 Tax=Ruegeria pomeroyi TaxID=89184 RepID=Q5LN81_RUEPO|nr:TIGR04282 family arsenosugar biosynthesis glycosyltransferase [Ruegeria pomeroyi]AAV96558.1 hypothetical protein SPO3331 [Ruegeria pomeroyi DSS-3]NVK96150.1 TIGR04282 family arsenosugar biosynthesis glycosyltransferase [Ruegeria pomeroyi]NVL01022.1 TIGR04282 family arsenosugar biosynthesis glycosyltransferase [Ruegeria pomeroyi]QWV10100.1 TIGR04282 family arsenosugar biosynthesis glycosyltransferase [Ruegeria pomeroyi]
MRRTLVIMVKEPRPGRVKTRLGRDIGMVGAAWWFRHQTRALIRRLRDPRWRIVLAVSPDVEGLASRVWPADLARSPQARGDLGQRMARQLRGAPKGPVCLIGADIPGVTRAHIARAFAALGRAEFVFGPAPDGGYWLVGAARRGALPPGLFGHVRWSSEHALEDTLAGLAGRRVALVDGLRDVDRLADLRDASPPGRASSLLR